MSPCPHSRQIKKVVDELFQLGGKVVIVENIPVNLCVYCGEATFSRETTEKIRQMVHGRAERVKSIEVDVFAYS